MVRRMLLTAATLALVGAHPALADSPERQGITNAKAAGMYVDPLIEPYMAAAPIGSCVNDPSQEKCPTTKAIVYSPDFFNVPEDQRPTVGTASRKRAKRIIARTLKAYNCGLKVNSGSPYRA